MKLVTKNSPNQSKRLPGAVRLIVCHTPEGGYDGTVRYCMTKHSDPRKNVSYHRLYKKDGTEATQLVPFARKAWHAGNINSISDGLSIEGHARHFNLTDPGTKEFAKGVAERLIARKLKPQWTTDVRRGGFCRHGDLQDDRTDPTPDIAEWRQFCAMVVAAYNKLKSPAILPGPSPKPDEFWAWADWKNSGELGPRPPLSAEFKADLAAGGWPWLALEKWNELHD
jgi:hypothetical protein